MNKEKLMGHILDSWIKPVVFVDMDHIIVYVNKTAREEFHKWGDILGKSIFDCHNPASKELILQFFEELKQGREEIPYEKIHRGYRIFMRRVLDEKGEMIGYYERYERATE